MPLIILIVFVAIAVFMIITFVRDRKTKQELRERGVTITAKVTDRTHEVRRETNDDTHLTTTTNVYYISYQYVVNETTYSGRDSVDTSVYDALSDGQPIEVVYLPENPAEVRLASSL
ncbi:MAG: DUF3592 domain-containing protein [Chloroflexota bacterium]